MRIVRRPPSKLGTAVWVVNQVIAPTSARVRVRLTTRTEVRILGDGEAGRGMEVRGVHLRPLDRDAPFRQLNIRLPPPHMPNPNPDADPSSHEAGPPFAEAVYRVVRSVPAGCVTSYGAVAAMVGAPRAARGVGAALNALPPDSDVPWWRVVNRNGEVSIPSELGLRALQRALLEREGVGFLPGGQVDLDRHAWYRDG